jgi:hypothetical protein
MTKGKQMYKLIVRFPDEMQEPLTAAANQTDRSINRLVVAAVRRYLADLAHAQADTQSAHLTSGAFVLPARLDGYAAQAASAE